MCVPSKIVLGLTKRQKLYPVCAKIQMGSGQSIHPHSVGRVQQTGSDTPCTVRQDIRCTGTPISDLKSPAWGSSTRLIAAVLLGCNPSNGDVVPGMARASP